MVTLASIAGIPIGLDEDSTQVVYDVENMVCGSTKHISLRDISPALLNKALRYPESVYAHHCNMVMKQDADKWPEKFNYEIIYLPAGLLGIEYIKTHIFYTAWQPAKAAAVIQVILGVLTVILQKNKSNLDPYDIELSVEDACIMEIAQGEKVTIPSGYYYTFVNTHEAPVVFARLVASEQALDYQTLQRVNGLAYYLIAKNARQELVTNPRYRSLVEVKQISVDELNTTVGYRANSKVPLYQEVCNNRKVFEVLLVA